MRFKVLEERLRGVNAGPRTPSEARSSSNGRARRQSLSGAENFSRISSNGYLSKRVSNPQYGVQRPNSAAAVLKNAKVSSRSFDGGSSSPDTDKPKENGPSNPIDPAAETTPTNGRQADPIRNLRSEQEDQVSGVLYDMLQKEVVTLRKACHEKDQTLKDKDDAIEVRLFNISVLLGFVTILLRS